MWSGSEVTVTLLTGKRGCYHGSSVCNIHCFVFFVVQAARYFNWAFQHRPILKSAVVCSLTSTILTQTIPEVHLTTGRTSKICKMGFKLLVKTLLRDMLVYWRMFVLLLTPVICLPLILIIETSVSKVQQCTTVGGALKSTQCLAVHLQCSIAFSQNELRSTRCANR